MTDNYHINAVRSALQGVKRTGVPCEVGSVYEAHLPSGETLIGLVDEFGLTMKICKSSGRAIIEKPYRRNT
jgi:hypothetical protein